MGKNPGNRHNRLQGRGRNVPPVQPVRLGYDSLGPGPYYALHAASYRNPHESAIRKLLSRWLVSANLPKTTHFIDLACGSGEVTQLLVDSGYAAITGIDPYTAEAYENRTGRAATALSFEQIAAGALNENHADVVICSFAMHLCEPSRLPALCLQLSFVSELLVILTPHKRPVINAKWGWVLQSEELTDRVRLRLYKRLANAPGENHKPNNFKA